MSVTPVTGAVMRFADYEADSREHTVRRNDSLVAIQDKPLQLLLALLERPGQLVSREELRNRLWPTDAFGAFEDGLNTAVRKLRIPLNDSAEMPQFIETVPRRGYRFIAPVDTVSVEPAPVSTSPAAPPVPTPAQPDSTTEAAPARMWSKALVAFVLLAVIAGVLWLAKRWRAPGLPPASRIASLAVLPMTNLTGDAAQNYFVDGMTDELTTSLAQLGGLRVVSETSAMHYRASPKAVRQIANELGVDAIVEGAVTRSGDQVRVTAQLVDARDDHHLWAESYIRTGGDVLGLQHDVARAIADQIHLTLTPAEAQRLQTLPTRNPQAYDAYLRANYFNHSGGASESDCRRAIAAAQQAVALDPSFAQAYVAVADAYHWKIFSWAGTEEDEEKAFVALEKALALNPNLPDAYNIRGNLYYDHLRGYDLVNAVANRQRAIALSPNFAAAHHLLGYDLTHAGLHDRAIKEFKTALQLDPLNDSAKYVFGRALWQSQRFEESIQNYDRYNIKSIEEALPLLYLGRRQQAWDLVNQLTPTAGIDFRAREDFPAVRALLYASEGKSREAEREIQEAVRLSKSKDHFHHSAFIIAASYAEMGKPHEAVEWLRRTAETGMPNYPLFRDNPSMKKLAGNPYYEQFMAELKPRWDQFAASLQ